MAKAISIVIGVLCTTYLLNAQTIVESDYSFVYNSGNITLKLENDQESSFYTVKKFGRVVYSVQLNEYFRRRQETEDGFILHGPTRDIEFKIIEDRNDFSLIRVSTTFAANQIEIHCIDLETGRMHWFGGPQFNHQYWPVEKLQLHDYSYLSKQQDNVAVAERYWVNSRGGFVYVDDKVPLFIDQNVNNNKLCLKAQIKLPYNPRMKSAELTYYLGVGNDARDAQRKAVAQFLKKPTGLVDRRMIEHPIWSTWARYKRNIDEFSVQMYAYEIESNGFNNSQLEIDDDWEMCYGSLTFNQNKFPIIRKQTDNLRSRGFRVTLWVHPFINKGCEPWYSEAKKLGYLVKDHNGSTDTKWWNSKTNGAALIDFTKSDATEWYIRRLKMLQEVAGIDSFKFDAGESSWTPSDPILNADLVEHPLAITKDYVRAVSQFGPMIEVRAGQGTQDLPIFLRFLDKDTEWGFNNGLATLITTLLQMNMVGYGFILPDMIGGNGYNHPPSEELFVRWLQANVFMPSIQYSYVPWDYSVKAIEICKKFTELHAKYTDEIMEALQASVDRGEPVNPPIWWLDPQDEVALRIDDEFLLGNRILAAPVIKEGAVIRDIYLPKGKWYDPNLNEIYTGPHWLNDYSAPINVLPYFIRQD